EQPARHGDAPRTGARGRERDLEGQQPRPLDRAVRRAVRSLRGWAVRDEPDLDGRPLRALLLRRADHVPGRAVRDLRSGAALPEQVTPGPSTYPAPHGCRVRACQGTAGPARLTGPG